MMKSRMLLMSGSGLLLILGFIFYALSTRDREPLHAFPATINNDCAPWDGAAFTLFIPHDHGASVYISIWKSPHTTLPVVFHLPDETARVGTATYVTRFSHTEPLSGKLFFWTIQPGNPVNGTFDFITESGLALKGKFQARWGNEVTHCR